MSLREALETEAARLRVQARPALPRPELPGVVARVCKRHDEGGKPLQPVDLAKLVLRFREAAAAGTLDQVSKREWKQVCWGIFDGPDPLAEDTVFLEVLLDRLWKGPSQPLCRRLITVYLAKFGTAPVTIHRVAQSLAALAPHWPWGWALRQQRFHLFEPEKAPLELARHCCATDAPLDAKLEEAGITGVCRFGGMEAAAFRASLKQMQLGLSNLPAERSGPLMERVLAWYESAREVGGKQVFHEESPALAAALLLPWRQATPAEALRQSITEFLLKHFKDPRIHPQNWLKVPEEATAVLRRWLTRIALEQFFQIVDCVAKDRQWKYRRAFWMSYYEVGVIEDAQVLFGPRARALLRSLVEDASAYGTIERPCAPNHCILLLSISGLTIAEVSQNGKCRIWKDGNPNAPVLHRGSYSLSDLKKSADFEQVHWGSPGYSWQRWVAGFIRSATGISVNETSWQPR